MGSVLLLCSHRFHGPGNHYLPSGILLPDCFEHHSDWRSPYNVSNSITEIQIRTPRTKAGIIRRTIARSIYQMKRGGTFIASGLFVSALLLLVYIYNKTCNRVEGMFLRRPSSDEYLKGLALTCASTSNGAKECGWLWEECMYGENKEACDALGEAGRMAKLRHGDEHPLVMKLT